MGAGSDRRRAAAEAHGVARRRAGDPRASALPGAADGRAPTAGRRAGQPARHQLGRASPSASWKRCGPGCRSSRPMWRGSVRPSATANPGTWCRAATCVLLQDRLARLLGDARLRLRQGQAARARYERHFTLDQFVSRTLAVYQDVLAERKSGGARATRKTLVAATGERDGAHGAGLRRGITLSSTSHSGRSSIATSRCPCESAPHGPRRRRRGRRAESWWPAR